MSGVSGHNARSFYYPEKAQVNCAGCHMPLLQSDDIAAKYFNPTNNNLYVHSHFFPRPIPGWPRSAGKMKSCKRKLIF